MLGRLDGLDVLISVPIVSVRVEDLYSVSYCFGERWKIYCLEVLILGRWKHSNKWDSKRYEAIGSIERGYWKYLFLGSIECLAHQYLSQEVQTASHFDGAICFVKRYQPDYCMTALTGLFLLKASTRLFVGERVTVLIPWITLYSRDIDSPCHVSRDTVSRGPRTLSFSTL